MLHSFLKSILLLPLVPLIHALDPKTVIDANGVSLFDKIEAIERQLLNPQVLNSLVVPCSLNAQADPHEGQQTSAEWTRIVFHDVITKGIAGAGLGGLDASIQFESNRAENIGVFVNVTMLQFSQFNSVFLSLSDLIGVGLADSLSSCTKDNRRLPLRVGRIDATGPGPAGVPGPADNFAFALAAFNRAGFSQSEMIQAIACGHTLGGVHGADFPDIGGPFNTDTHTDPNTDPNNTSGRKTFDSTPDVFDNAGVNEYISGTGLKGGPLVVGLNSTENSDLRIFSSDNNATIKAMLTQQSFEDTCFTIFAKMMSTVPAAVTLSDPFQVRPWIMGESHLDLTTSGQVSFSGVINAHGTTAPPNAATYSYGTTSGGNTGTKTSGTGVILAGASVGPNQPADASGIGYGIIKAYSFNDIITGQNVNSMTVTSSGSTYSGAINTNIFVVPSQSFQQQNSGGTGTWMVRVAILSSLTTSSSVPVATAFYRVPQAGSIAAKVVKQTSNMAFEKTIGSYKIYKTSSFSNGPTPPAPNMNGNIRVSLGSSLTSAMSDTLIYQTNCTQDDISQC